MPAILYLVVRIVGYFFGQEAISGQLSEQIDALVGNNAAETIEQVLATTEREEKSIFTAVLSFATVIIGSTTVFGSIQGGLNRIWKVKASPSAGIGKRILDRLFSLTIVITLGFLMIVSLVIDAGLAYFAGYLKETFPDTTVYVANALNVIVSLGVIGVLFTFLLKLLPDVKLQWKHAWIGGVSTALLFFLGKYLIGFYLIKSNLGSSYGAAGSLVLILVWVYYSSLILLLGGKITETYAKRQGKIRPSRLAVRFEIKSLSKKK